MLSDNPRVSIQRRLIFEASQLGLAGTSLDARPLAQTLVETSLDAAG
ncbi:MAG: hypothetical protein ACRD5Z_22270 [Bryobacteraceae bacterium]